MPAVIVRALERQGIQVERKDESEFTLDSDEQWLLFGERTGVGAGPAAVAACGMLWLDRSASAPLLLLDQTPPSSFLPREFFVVRQRAMGTGARLKASMKGRPRQVR